MIAKRTAALKHSIRKAPASARLAPTNRRRKRLWGSVAAEVFDLRMVCPKGAAAPRMKARPRSTIRLQLRELAQLFNSMDPSPFHDRDLDADAEEFILSWARELPPTHELELSVRLVTPAPAGEGAADIEAAVQHYFLNRAEMKHREFRQLMRRGRISLLVGLMFLASCLGLSDLVEHATAGASAFLKTSLTIGGWVAMWRPLEIYLYDWWPMRVAQRVLGRLARLRVKLVAPPPLPPGP